MAPAAVPAYSDLLWPTLSAVRALGGSGSIEEIVEVVLKQEDFTDEQQQLLKQYDLSTRTTTRVVEDVAVDHDFFSDL